MMKRTITIVPIFFVLQILNSCLVPPAPHKHYFKPQVNQSKNVPKVMIFSTPKSKNYVITNVNSDSQVFIKSPIFENPETFYPTETKDFFENKAKEFVLHKTDSKFYRNGLYKNITLKILHDEKIELFQYYYNK